MAEAEDELIYEVDGGVAVIRLNRPRYLGAFTWPMINAWARALREAQEDEDVRVVVLTGTGEGFCSGVDLKALDEIEATPIERKRMLTDRVHKVARAVEDLDKPLIAAVNGVAVGAGMDMALMCDMRFAARSARFSEGYIRIGLIPGDGGAYFLPRLVGPAKAMELLMTGDFVDADEALRLGIVNRVYDDEALMAETMEFARGIAAKPPIAISMIKRAVYQSARADLRTSLDLISSHMAIVQATDDYAEAMTAFREKRPGRYRNR
ncbi:enoyl-CoA hydratase/isomerase family protein [Nonomuraea sp. CA-218870]|uniref:enoyl-CoA hydratase/isomerase family protein n=1 Tax=Nonomuraea sp. CA-218870 TaxID=3239998 RepID=UPI003D8BD7B4